MLLHDDVSDPEGAEEPPPHDPAGRVLDGDLEALPADLALELVRGALGDHATVVDDHDVVREQVCLLEVLGGEQQGGAAGDETLDHLPHLGAAAGVEPRGGLVEEHHRRVGDEGAGEVQAAAHATGVPAGDAVAGVVEPELHEQLAGALLGAGTSEVVEPAHHGEVLEAGQVLVHRGVLARDADLAPHLGRMGGHVPPRHLGTSGVRLDQRRQDLHRGRLPRAVRSEHPEDRALGDAEIESVECLDVLVVLHQAFGHHRVSHAWQSRIPRQRHATHFRRDPPEDKARGPPTGIDPERVCAGQRPLMQVPAELRGRPGRWDFGRPALTCGPHVGGVVDVGRTSPTSLHKRA